jgi:hypothetical protein
LYCSRVISSEFALIPQLAAVLLDLFGLLLVELGQAAAARLSARKSSSNLACIACVSRCSARRRRHATWIVLSAKAMVICGAASSRAT